MALATKPTINLQKTKNRSNSVVFNRKINSNFTRYNKLTNNDFFIYVCFFMLTGILLVIWLTSQGVKQSYVLEDKYALNAKLSEELQTLQKEIYAIDSPAALNVFAFKQGMVPVVNPLKLVPKVDGKILVVGEVKPQIDSGLMILDDPVNGVNVSDSEITVPVVITNSVMSNGSIPKSERIIQIN